MVEFYEFFITSMYYVYYIFVCVFLVQKKVHFLIYKLEVVIVSNTWDREACVPLNFNIFLFYFKYIFQMDNTGFCVKC